MGSKMEERECRENWDTGIMEQRRITRSLSEVGVCTQEEVRGNIEGCNLWSEWETQDRDFREEVVFHDDKNQNVVMGIETDLEYK